MKTQMQTKKTGVCVGCDWYVAVDDNDRALPHGWRMASPSNHALGFKCPGSGKVAEDVEINRYAKEA